MQMTEQKWRSPTGHSIASDVTDKLPPKTDDFLTRGNDDVQAALGEYQRDGLIESADWLEDCADCMDDEGLDRDNHARHFRAGANAIRAALTAKQEPVNIIVSNLTILMFLMGYQGGTIHQCAEYLQTTTDDILNATKERMEHLMRVAQLIGAKRYTADMTDALKYAHSQMQPFCDDTIVRQAIYRADQKGGV